MKKEVQLEPSISLKIIIKLALEYEKEMMLSDHEKKHEHQLCDQTIKESIIYKEKCEKKCCM